MNNIKEESTLSGKRKRITRKGRKVIGKGAGYIKLNVKKNASIEVITIYDYYMLIK